MLRTCSVVLLMLTTTVSSQASEGELTGTLWVAPEYHRSAPDAVFFIPKPFYKSKEYSSRQELEGSYQQGGFNLLATASLALQENGTESKSKGILNELYYDTKVAGQEMSFGKKIISWGVGYGFRPLDVVQQEDRRRLFLRTLEGVPLVAWDYFTDKSAVTLAYINPFRGQHNNPIDEESLALNYYRQQEKTDLHIVARLSNHNKMEIGTGFANVITDSLEWHGSVLYQYRYDKWLNRLTEPGNSWLATDDPMQQRFFHNGIKASVGLNWTHLSGIAFLGEFWFDDSAYSKGQWDALRQLTQRQRSLLEMGTVPADLVYSNIGASSQFLSQSNLLQQNLLLRFSYDNGKSTVSALDWLYTPQDEGSVLTASVTHEFDRHRIELGLRTFGGSAGSAYRAIPEDLVIYLTWQIAVEF